MANKKKTNVKSKNNLKQRKKSTKSKKKRSKFKKHYILWSLYIIIFTIIAVSIYNVFKPLPHGVSKLSSETKTDEVELLTDLSYKSGNEMHYDHEIFDKVNETIQEANDFIIMDMFLFNGYQTGDKKYPPISKRITDSLIQKKQENPNVRIIILTDPINTFYGSYTPDNIKDLKNHNIDVRYTNLSKLRDSNPIYSGAYRTLFQWFGNSEKGKLPNPLSGEAPNVTVRSYLKLLNMKANHRKTLVTENHGMILSSNPHDPSGYHQNVGVRVSGPIQRHS